MEMGKTKALAKCKKPNRPKPKREMRRFKCGNGKMQVHKVATGLTEKPGISPHPGSGPNPTDCTAGVWWDGMLNLGIVVGSAFRPGR